MKKNYIILVFVVAIILVSGCKTTTDTAMDKNDSNMTKKDEGTMQDKETSFMGKGIVLAGTKTPFIDFNKEDYDKALSDGKVVFLYFYANWCPICRAEEPKAREAFNELNKENVVGFRVNYKDSETDKNEEDLAKQFGITYQHTKIIIKNSQRVLKDGNSWNKETYISEINKYA